MRILALAGRLVPLAGGASVAVAYVHTIVGVVGAIVTTAYTAFLAGESALRLWKAWEAHKEAQRSKSPRTKADA